MFQSSISASHASGSNAPGYHESNGPGKPPTAGAVLCLGWMGAGVWGNEGNGSRGTEGVARQH